MSFSRRISRHSVAPWIAGLTVAVTVAVPGTAALANTTARPRTSGVYQSGKTSTGRSVFFNVVKKHGKQRVANFEIFCSTTHKDGSVYHGSLVPIGSSGKFSYRGSATEYQGGIRVGKAVLRFSGRFLSATKAAGTASFTRPTARLSGCPAHSFTARWRPETGD
jgi:hypothetical protein